MKLILWFTLFILITSPHLYAANDEKVFSLSFGPVNIGESRIPIDLNNFYIHIKRSHLKIESHFIEDSVQWIRTTSNLLSPRVRIALKVYSQRTNIHIRYRAQSMLLEKRNNYLYTEIYIPLFNPGNISIVQENKEISTVSVFSKQQKQSGNTQLIDYSCAKYHVKIEGLDDEYLSAGCHLERQGKWGNESPRLEVSWMSTNYRLADGSAPPYLAIFNSNEAVYAQVINQSGEKRSIKISAEIPKRLHRLKTAVGFGPYLFDASDAGRERDKEITPSFMLYGNLNLTPDSSIRAFNATVWNQSVFNNFGFYFAYEVGSGFDQRISVIPLLGIQGLAFEYESKAKTYSKIIYPQGFEIVFRHPFSLENYSLVYGMFVSTSTDITYNNIWLRFGKKYFWELNYIDWKEDDQASSMAGISVGIPFISLF